MAYYCSLGRIPKHRHTALRDENGKLFYEELMGEEGFSSDSSLLYHKEIPSALVGVREWELPDQTLIPNHPLLPRHLKPHSLPGAESGAEVDAVTGRMLLLGNSDVRLSYAHVNTTSPLYKSGLGDEMVYVERGSALVETQFGALEVAEGDYINIPRATIHRWVIRGDETARLFFIEANSHIGPPRRYISNTGQYLEHSPLCERDIRGPEEVLIREGEDVEVYIKHRGPGQSGISGSIHVLPTHPFDVVGWDGCLYPWVFNINDYMPITGKVHQPPPSHQVFEGHNFVICNFVPRLVDYAEGAIPVPYYHSNVDSDELMFYVDGDYEARKGSGIDKGSMTLHPGGHPHGPQPGAMEASIGKTFFDEMAVMVDTFRPLALGRAALEVNDEKYASSWAGGRWLAE
ncbi:homogentisate 1,2-dioxygenase [Brevibacterium ravenspurgense]|uniref:homogentisate 1,2-dioxygenase n=1 Tax=Brevibacterium ravenspurgense TaxID=479117 RepID=UPI001EF2E95B|nr:homogentisate 1,2-dioxygenase domain-containing protein [Brevibacterium ravenspurgense]MCG7300556.1 homogentisate 1,2-dioxygenase [Brevibacterium ravenspurgense]